MITKFNFEGERESMLMTYDDTAINYLPYYGRPIHEKGDKMLVVGGAGDYFSDDLGFAAMIDKHSTVDWLKVYPPSEESYTYRFITGLILENGKLLFLANRHATGLPGSNDVSVVLLCADSLGNILWEREYESATENFKHRSKW